MQSWRIAVLLYYFLALPLATIVIFSAGAAARAYQEFVVFQTVDEKTDTLVKEVIEDLTLGLYRGGSEKAEAVGQLAREAARHDSRVRRSAWTLAGISAAFLTVLAIRGLRLRDGAPAGLVLHLLAVAAICLMIGLLAPILTISAHKEVAVLGRVMLQYETRDILSTVAKLAATGHYPLAALLTLFSVVVPIAKLALSALAIGPVSVGVRTVAGRTVELVGKWSMTDVFVVAVLLAFLAARTEQLTDATVGPGLYFFAAYGVLSLAAAQLMVRFKDASFFSSG